MSENVQCPVCSKFLSKTNINRHVNKCLNDTETSEDITVNSSDTVISDDSQAPPPKRQKTDSDTDTCQNESSACHARASGADPWHKNIKSTVTTTREKVEEERDNKPKHTTAKAISPFFQRKNFVSKSKNEKVTKSPTNSSSSATESCITSNAPKLNFIVNSNIPLAEQMRPSSLDLYFGQNEAVGSTKILRNLIETAQIPSIILWGPPGCGKTTLAKIIAQKCKVNKNMRYTQLSATTSGVADVKEVIKIAKNEAKMFKRKTVLFIDEIHRFNKLQQDTFLPHVEDGTITLIGATTENPSFQVNNALLSRCRVVVLQKIPTEDIEKILERALQSLNIKIVDKSKQNNNDLQSSGVVMEKEAVKTLAVFCDGDARCALTCLQIAVDSKKAKSVLEGRESTESDDSKTAQSSLVIDAVDIKDALQKSHIQYDRAGEEHYNCASAFQKSIRGSDDSAAVYWLARMLEGGEDPLFIARRLVVIASEDVGLADNHALPLAVATFQACHTIGKPECRINLAHCTTYLARAPKSCESYMALNAASQNIKNHPGPLPGVPLHLRPGSTSLMKNLGYGKGYKYNHAYDEPVQQDYLPESLKGVNFFEKKT